MDIGYSARRNRPVTPMPSTSRPDPGPEHEAGRMEALAQALAVIGQVEGGFRIDADGDAEHPSFRTADLLRELSLTIRQEVGDPSARSTLEVLARAEEAHELSEYVLEASAVYGSDSDLVVEVLTHVAGDIRKGTEGVNWLKLAADMETDPELLGELQCDPDEDVRWWAAQNPSTPVSALQAALADEVHPMVLAALLNNANLPDEDTCRFVSHPSPDVARIAQRRSANVGKTEN